MGQQEQGGRMVCQEMPHRVSRKPDVDAHPRSNLKTLLTNSFISTWQAFTCVFSVIC